MKNKIYWAETSESNKNIINICATIRDVDFIIARIDVKDYASEIEASKEAVFIVNKLNS